MKAKTALVWTLMWLMLLATPVSATEPGFWRCDGKFGLCRYLSSATKQEIIPARFEWAMSFSEGLAAVSINGRFGYVDERGEIVIEPKFDLAGAFAHGLAEVLVGDKTGIVNRKGEIVVPPMFRRAIPLTSDVIVAQEGGGRSPSFAAFGTLDQFPVSPSDLTNSGLYHISGHWTRRPGLKRVSLFDKQGRGLVWASDRDDGLFGLLASNGEWVVPPQYEYASALHDDRAIVRKRVNGVELDGAVDPTGQIVVPLQPRGLFYWRNGLGIAKEGSKQALLDLNGNMIGGRYFDAVERAEQGDVSKVLIDGRWQGIDRAGNIVPNPDNGKVVVNCPNGLRAISIDGKIRFVDRDGQPTTPYLFEPLVFRVVCDRPVPVRLNGLYSFVGVDGRLLVDPPAFKNLYGFEGGYALAFDGQQWSVIDTSGRFVSSIKFDQYLGRSDELFHFMVDGREVWLTARGKERPAPPVPPAPPPKILDCGHGLRLFDRDGRWGILDAEGAEVIAPRWRALDCYRNGVAWAAIDSRRQWCAFGPNGVPRDRPACLPAHYPTRVSHSTPEVFDRDPFENSVLWSRAYLEYGAGRRDRPPQWVSDGVR